MARIVEPAHFYRDCLNISSFGQQQRDLDVCYGPVYTLGKEIFGNLPSGYAVELCELCWETAIDADEINDFNSVWFGLGPDMNAAPTGALRGMYGVNRTPVKE